MTVGDVPGEPGDRGSTWRIDVPYVSRRGRPSGRGAEATVVYRCHAGGSSPRRGGCHGARRSGGRHRCRARLLRPGAEGPRQPGGLLLLLRDRQRDTAGITRRPDDRNYRIDNYVYDQPGPLVGQDLASTETFVLSKSGISPTGSRAVSVAGQRIEYADAARTTPVQIRCKMRTRESLTCLSRKQRFDNDAVARPVGFRPSAATGAEDLPRRPGRARGRSVELAYPAQQAAAPSSTARRAFVLGPTQT